MIVRRLVIERHQLLRELAGYLEAVSVPPLPCRSRGDLRADIDGGPPGVDQNRPRSFRWLSMRHPIRLPSMLEKTIVASLNYYPAGGGQGWHTDSAAYGWRVYIGRPLSAARGVFLTPGVRTYDEPGIATAFYVSGRPCDSWHAVEAPGPRVSVGARIRDLATVRELGLEG